MRLADLRRRRFGGGPHSLRAVALSAAAALVVGCGGGESAHRASSAAATSGTVSTQSAQSAVDPDHDDHITEGYGRPASGSVGRAVTAAVKAYYGVALAGDGGSACTLIVPTLAKSVPEDYGRPPGPPALRGGTCAVVVSKLFKQHHAQLASEVPTMRVRRVRVQGDSALAFLAFETTPEPRDIGLTREGGEWKVSGLLDNSLP